MKRLAVLIAMLPALAFGQAYRVGSGIQAVPRTSAPTKETANASFWYRSTDSSWVATTPGGTSTAVVSGSAYTTVQDEGSGLTQRSTLNFTGSGISCSDSGGKTVCNVSGGGGGGYYQTVESNGSAQTQRDALNFSSLFTLSDSSSPSRTTVTLANTAVTPGSGYSTFTVDAQGRITSAGYLSLSGIVSSTAADNVMGLLSTSGPVAIEDNATPVSGALFRITGDGDGDQYLLVDAHEDQAVIASTGLKTSQPNTTGTNASLIVGGATRGGIGAYLPAATELTDLYMPGATYSWTGGGSWAQQRFARIGQATIDFSTTGTIPVAAQFWVDGNPIAGAGATITLPVAIGTAGRIFVDASASNDDNAILVRGGGITIDDPDEEADRQFDVIDSSGNSTFGINGVGAGRLINLSYARAQFDHGSHIRIVDESTPIVSPLIEAMTNGGTSLFSVTPSAISAGTGFIYDASNTRLKIGNPGSPAGRLHVVGTTGSNAYIRVDNTTGSIYGGLGGADSNNTVWVGSLSNHPVAIRVNNTDVVTVSSSAITPTVPITGSGYIGMSDQAALGATSTSSTTYVDVGNGSSTGFATYTMSSVPVTKTYLVRVNVRFYMSTLGTTATTYFQLLKDGSTIAGHPVNVNKAPIGVAGSTYADCAFDVPVALTAGATPVFKLQWKVGDAGATANVTTTVGTMQLTVIG